MLYIILILAALHGLTAAWLLRSFEHSQQPNRRRWQLASLIFPLGVLLAIFIQRRRLSK